MENLIIQPKSVLETLKEFYVGKQLKVYVKNIPNSYIHNLASWTLKPIKGYTDTIIVDIVDVFEEYGSYEEERYFELYTYSPEKDIHHRFRLENH